MSWQLIPSVSPASGVIVDDHGRVWVAREALRHNALKTREVVHENGSLAFRVERPRRPSGFSVIGDKICSVVRDSSR